jgi:hypothetical protein
MDLVCKLAMDAVGIEPLLPGSANMLPKIEFLAKKSLKAGRF